MNFKDKYTIDKTKEPDKELISIDYYALCEVIQELKNTLNRLINRWQKH